MSTVKESTLNAEVVLLGDAGVGAKTSLVFRFVNDAYDEHTTPTIGSDFFTKDFVVEDVKVKLKIWGLRSHTKMKKAHIVVNADVYMHRHCRIGTFSCRCVNGSPRCTSSNSGL